MLSECALLHYNYEISVFLLTLLVIIIIIIIIGVENCGEV